METRVVNYKGYAITATEGTKRGIFFRNPIQKVYFEDDYTGLSRFSAWTYKTAIKNPLKRLFEIIIGNGNIVHNIDSWYNEDDFAGFCANVFCFPIYFKREYRKLTAVCNKNDSITKINSYGYENGYTTCAGKCDKEKTTVKLKTGKNIKLKSKGVYHFTYLHIIEDIISTGCIESSY